MENYHGVRKIGRGSYGEVWLVKSKRDKKQYVLKQINLQNASKRELRAANLEVQLLATLRHPNIVSYHDSFESNDGFLYIVMGYCEGGDLYGKIREQKGVNFSEAQIVEWFIQICMAIQYLHERNILHRDLKTQNIFLTKNKIVKVGDLGIAKVLDGETAMATTLIGTPYYMSPELFSNRPYNYKSDVWALGCCVYELATLKHAFNARDMNALMYKIIRGKMPSMPTMYSSELLELIRGMLNQNPDKRPSVYRILRHAYIKKNISIYLEGTRLRQKSNSNVNPQQSSSSHNTNSRSVVAVPTRPCPVPQPPAVNVCHRKSPTRDRSGSSSGSESVPKPTCHPDLSVQGKRLSPDAEVSNVAEPNAPKSPRHPPKPDKRSPRDDNLTGPGQPDQSRSADDNHGAKTVDVPLDSGAKYVDASVGPNEPIATNEILDCRNREQFASAGLSCRDVELCIDGQEIKLGDRLQGGGGGGQSPTRGSPDRGYVAGRHVKKARARLVRDSYGGGASSREISETLQKECDGGSSSVEEDQSESSVASSNALELPPLETSNKENEMTRRSGGQTTSSSQFNDSSESKPRVRRRKKLPGNQQPIPVTTHRPLPPVPQTTIQPTVPVLPNVDSSQYPRRPNSVARQRRREKLSQERDATDNVKCPLIDELPVSEKTVAEYLNNRDSIDQISSSVDKPVPDKHNCDQDMASLIDLLNTTLKDELDSPPTSVAVSPRKTQLNNHRHSSEIHEVDASVRSRCSSRLEQRYKILENDCLRGLGEVMLSRAMDIITNKDTKEMQDELQNLLGTDKCNEFIGMLWQMKLCKESLSS